MSAKPLILVVEDDPQQSALVVEIINETGLYQALCASDGEEAFEVLRAHQRGFNFLSNRIACILLDW